ncbi:Sapep family Mn(2+)-dependent dipeptidase [candidate division WOR-3 bacterium]|nr:Sapep family Mn(2+)-dependent dipeptidase [candidate division WOR-3 bacterium]
MTAIQKNIDDQRENILSDISELIEIPSVKSEALPGAPFGGEVSRVFDKALALGKKLGLKSFSGDGHYVYFEIGEGSTLGSILCHLDVVPAESGWKHPPFKGTLENGNLYGRGVEDDKGPAVCSLYALHILQNTTGVKGRLRLILGGDEESSWKCIEKYKETEEIPLYGITPDSQFPVIYAEKNIFRINLTVPFESKYIDSVFGGSAVNMVPDNACAVLKQGVSLRGEEDIIKKHFSDTLTVGDRKGKKSFFARGKSAHASTPDKGKNAVSTLFDFLSKVIPPDDPFKLFIDFYAKNIAHDHRGENLGIALEDEVSGHLTINPGLLLSKEGLLRISNDIRCPIKYKVEEVVEILEKIEFPGFKIEVEKTVPGLYVPKDSPLVSVLLDVYRKITGDTSPPLAIGGGTYARAFPNTVAFGPVFPKREIMAHQPDEFMPVEDIFSFTEILTQALFELDYKYAGEGR